MQGASPDKGDSHEHLHGKINHSRIANPAAHRFRLHLFADRRASGHFSAHGHDTYQEPLPQAGRALRRWRRHARRPTATLGKPAVIAIAKRKWFPRGGNAAAATSVPR